QCPGVRGGPARLPDLPPRRRGRRVRRAGHRHRDGAAADLLTPMLTDAPALASADDTGDAAATLVYFILGVTVAEQTASHLAEVSGGDAPGHEDGRIANGTALILAGMASEA